MIDISAIVGLGNPGERYARTRHNLGFVVVDSLARSAGFGWNEGEGEYWIAGGCFEGESVMLVKPTTYMNRSGVAVAHIIERLDLDLERLLVVLDDVNLPLGKIRLRAKGSDGGHKGLFSVIAALDSEDFPRLRLGIGGPPEGVDLVEYVLSEFDDAEMADADRMIEEAIRAVKSFVLFGIEVTMDSFNC